ncbi:hypothetical protein EON80_02025 [bacterium]|nr:MAG: hypothetical protein EON80_02025 [bacterium]
MKTLSMPRPVAIGVVVLTMAGFLSQTAIPAPKAQLSREAKMEWIAHSLREMQTIKPGMTGKQLLKVFTVEGGVQQIPPTRYVYRDCPMIKVDIEWKNVHQPRPTQTHKKTFVISKISKPYLEGSIVD